MDENKKTSEQPVKKVTRLVFRMETDTLNQMVEATEKGVNSALMLYNLASQVGEIPKARRRAIMLENVTIAKELTKVGLTVTGGILTALNAYRSGKKGGGNNG